MEREQILIHHGTRTHQVGEPCPICDEAKEEFEKWVRSEDYQIEKESYGEARHFPTPKNILRG